MIIDKEVLEHTFNGNIFETAAQLRVSVQTVMATLTKFNMVFEAPTNIYHGLKKTSFSKFQQSILIGSILGDGHLERAKNSTNACFREEHAIDQESWLRWKYDNLKPFTTADMWIRDRGKSALLPDGHGGKKLYNIQQVAAMSTGRHPYLTQLHQLFYIDRVKVLPIEFLKDNFDMVVLAVLVGDDGNFCENSIRICTESFTKNEVEFLSSLCAKFYKSRITLRTDNSGKKCRIVFTEIKKHLSFFEELRNILPKCMHHKVTPVLNEHQVATHVE